MKNKETTSKWENMFPKSQVLPSQRTFRESKQSLK